MKDEDKDSFLSRWSRRKAEAKAEPAVGPGLPAEAPGQEVQPEPEFDVTQLPSLDSLTKDSDFSVFLQKGVPQALKSAALQKMWMSDPAIRDYIGPSEMSWDFNAAEPFAGYGALSPDADVVSMVRDIAEGQAKRLADALEAEGPVRPETESVAEAEGALELLDTEDADAALRHQEPVIQNGTKIDHKPAKRRHGAAIPR